MRTGIEAIVNAALCENNPEVAQRRAKVLLLIRDGVRHIDNIVEATGARSRSISYGDIKYMARKGFLNRPQTAHGDAARRLGVCPTVPLLTPTDGGERFVELIDS